MGEVFRARDTRLNRDVAVKVLPRKVASDPDRLRRFEQEARTLATLNHPNILTIFETGVHEGAPYLVSELLDGRTLREVLGGGRGVALSVRKAADYALQIAHGLAAAHSKGVIHRDLKPENIFISKDGRVKILDFGLAKLKESSHDAVSSIPDPAAEHTAAATIVQQTQPGMIVGTPAYMSPEQVRGEPADHRSDIFAFGCVLYEMLSGNRVFRRDTAVQSMNAILSEDPPELHASYPNLPPALEQTMRRCLEKHPESRFQSAQDLAFGLEVIAGGSQAREAIGAHTAAKRPTFAKMLVVLAMCLAGFVAAVGMSWFRPTPPSPIAASVRNLTYSGYDFSPSVAPDGKRICFRSDRDGTNRLWLKEIGSGLEAPLTSGPDDFPRFSPDGNTILFTRTQGGKRGLFRISSQLGGESARIVDDAVSGDWAPDGRKITFVRWTDQLGCSLHTVGVDGSAEALLHHFADKRGSWPRWSPDGKTIALSINLVGRPQSVALINVATRQLKSIPAPHAYNQLSSVAWEPNSQRLYCMQAESGSANSGGSAAALFRYALGLNKFQKLLWSSAHSRVLDWLPSGNILLDTRSSRENLKELPLGTNQASPRSLTFGNSTDRQPTYSPDGEEVLFSSNRTGNLEIWSISRKTKVVRRLTDHPADDWDPGLSADGKYLLWSANRSSSTLPGNLEIWIAQPDGTAPRPLTHDGFAAENPTMTRDGRWVVYTASHPEKAGLWKVHPDGTGTTQITHSRSSQNAEVSPDGRYVAYVEDVWELRPTIKVMEIESGVAVPFVISIQAVKETAAILGRCRWMPDGKALAYLGQDERGVNGIWVQDFVPGVDTSRTRRPLAGFDPENSAESFGISPNGQFITIASWEQFYSIMLTQDLPAR